MQQSKLFELYQELDKKELRSFKKWVASPLHNEHEDVRKLFDFIETRYSWTALTLHKERVWDYLYPQKKYDDNRLRYIMSLSLEVLVDFVGYNWSIKDEVEVQKNRIRALQHKKLIKQTKKPLQKAEKILDQRYQDADFHYHQYRLEELKFELVEKIDRTQQTNITMLTKHNTLFFMITTLRYACIALSHKTIKNTEYDIDMLGAVLEQIEKYPKYQKYPVLMLYYHGYYTLKGNESNFIALKNYLHDKTILIEDKEKRELLLMGINYAIKQLNIGDKKYIREAFEWYRIGLEQSLLLDKGRLSRFAYSNIIDLGLNLKEFDWIELFINQYTSFLDEVNRVNFKQYNLAKLNFSKGKLEIAKGYLGQADYEDLLLNIEAKVLLLKIYYQEGYYDALDALLDSFRVFLGRKKVLSYHKQNYMNLILMTKRILNIGNDKRAIEKLKKRIINIHPLTAKKWLLEQLGK
jgi:hypothetical protein